VRIRTILRSRLPERLAGRFPPALVELVVGLIVPVACVGLRFALTPIAGDRAPYAFNFAAIVIAAVLAGWRSGALALVFGQFLTWQIIVTPALPALVVSDRLGGLILSTISGALVLAVTALYQREVTHAMSAQARQVDLQSEALREIDHRTRNNYQTVVALIRLQAQRTRSAEVKRALNEAADRVRAVSLASDQLAMWSDDLGTVRLGEHLRELCHQIRRGLAGDGVRIDCDFSDLTTRADTAIQLSIIVNELVTNALKHAFDDGRGEIRVRCAPAGGGLELEIADNGSGLRLSGKKPTGLGTRLVERFVKELGAHHEVVSSGNGTTHRIRLDSLA
jgi:two-component system, sensor histidine kinase PdtaS